PSETIIKASRLYAKSPSSCIYLGNALDQHTGTSQAIRAITSLIAVTGNLDVPGGNVMISPLQLAKKPPENHSLLPKEQVDKQLGKEFLLSRFEFTRLCHPPTVYKAILDEKPYPVKAAFIMAANPALTSPNSNMVKRALKKLDFFVVTDLFMTETAKLADIVLPASTFLEQTYYATYQPATDILPENPGLVMLRPQIISPLYKSRSDWDIISALAKKMGYEEHFEWKNIEEAIDEELSYTGITVEQLKKHPEGIPIEGPSFLYAKFGEKGVFGKLMIKLLNKFKFSDYPWVYRKYEKIGFQTDSGKVELVSQQFKNLGLDVLPIYHEPIHSPCNTDQAEEYPLILTTGAKTRWFVHSQMRNIAKLGNEMPKNFMEINPKTARRYDVTDGEEVIVTSPNGSMNVMTKFTDKILQDVVQIYHGFPKSNVNCITNNQSFDPVTGSTPLRSSLCRVDKIENL
ncbi:molybdopterin-dependent oxidoreductase, partial [archaeon]|nr:molybdopterin-dependent oxidoreductase [archaeon]